jgi:hypothetical protein
VETGTRRVIRGILWGTLFGAALMLVFAPAHPSKNLAKKPRLRRVGHHLTEAQLDEMIEETFPASDPPSY